jgi:hypothetical protein
MGLFEYNRPVSSISEGSSDQGSREKGSLDNKVNQQNCCAYLPSNSFWFYASIAEGTVRLTQIIALYS